MNKTQENRTKALKWWNSLEGITQRMYFLRYYNPFERTQNSLTGREIQLIWEKEIQFLDLNQKNTNDSDFCGPYSFPDTL